MQRLEYVLSRNLESPFGKQSVFFETFVVPPEDFNAIPETKETEGIKYTFILCKSGVDVFSRYEKDEVEDKQFKVFYEEDSPDKSNFFGTACRVKIGKDAKEFFNRIYLKNQSVNFRGVVYDYHLHGFDELVKVLANEKNINSTLLKGAIYLEIAEQSKLNEVYKEVFSVNNKLADWLRGGIEAIEKWKFIDENYDYQKHFLNIRNSNPTNPKGYQPYTYKPIIPIPAFMNYADSIYGTNKQDIVDKGLSKLSGFVDSFDEISTATVFNIVKATPNISDDIFFAVVFYVKNFIEDHIPESIKSIYNKLKTLFKEVLNVAKQIGGIIKEKVGSELAKINAFLCGLLNGLISLARIIIMLLAMVTDNIPFLEMEKASPLELAKHQEKLEFIEDFVDLFSKNSKELLGGVKNLFSDSKIWKELSTFISGLKKKFLSLNEYFWAYFIGAVAFELILDVVIAYFTGGSSLVASLSAKIGKATTKIQELGIKGLNIGKNLGKKVATTADDLLKWLRKEFEELVEAIKSGQLANYLKKKFYELTDDVEGLRKLALSKWLKKFDKNFVNHLSGDIELIKVKFTSVWMQSESWLYRGVQGQGGHWLNKFLKVDKVTFPQGISNVAQLADDVPFKAKITIKSSKGKTFPKLEESSMFPKNWSLDRVKEEVAFVYENTVAKGAGLKNTQNGISNYEGISTKGFEIRIQIKDGNIINAHPINF